MFDSPFSSLGLPQRYSPAARWSSRNRFSLWCGSLVGHQRWVFLIQRKGKPSFIALKCWNINWHCCVIYVIISKYIYIYCIDFKYDSIYNSQKPYSSIMVKLIGVQTNDCDWLFNSWILRWSWTAFLVSRWLLGLAETPYLWDLGWPNTKHHRQLVYQHHIPVKMFRSSTWYIPKLWSVQPPFSAAQPHCRRDLSPRSRNLWQRNAMPQPVIYGFTRKVSNVKGVFKRRNPTNIPSINQIQCTNRDLYII